jgi:hypothetical protein
MEATNTIWGHKNWDTALQLLQQAQAEIDQLRAALAAVPVEALRRYLRYSQVPDRHHRYDAAEQRADEAAITAWLAQQSEVQP